MDWSVRCPVCGGAGKIERTWQGYERIACDAYRQCRLTRWGYAVPQTLSPGEWEHRLDEWREAAA